MVLARLGHAEEMVAVGIESIAATGSYQPRQSVRRYVTMTAAASHMPTLEVVTVSSTDLDRTEHAPSQWIPENLTDTTTLIRVENAPRMELWWRTLS